MEIQRKVQINKVGTTGEKRINTGEQGPDGGFFKKCDNKITRRDSFVLFFITSNFSPVKDKNGRKVNMDTYISKCVLWKNSSQM